MPLDCRPPRGKVYLTIGQDLFSVSDYLEAAYNASLHDHLRHYMHRPKQQHNHSSVLLPPRRASVFPAAFMAYSDLETLAGLSTPTDYGSGIEYADGLAQLVTVEDASFTTKTPAIPTIRAGLQLGLWLGGTDGCRAVVNGTWHSQVDRLVHYIAEAPFVKVFVRLGYEFDNPSFGYYNADRPTLYAQAWRIVVQACREHALCHRKALFVWHSWGAGLLPNFTLTDFYPGDDYVDWIGVSIFQQVYHHSRHNQTTTKNNNNDATATPSIWSGGSYDTLRPVLELARTRDKPLMIAESTPFGWGVAYDDHVWTRWFVPVWQLIQEYDDVMAMWCYIDCYWESQPMWHGVGFGDTRLSRNATVHKLWRQHILENTLGYDSLATYCTSSPQSKSSVAWTTEAKIAPPVLETISFHHKTGVALAWGILPLLLLLSGLLWRTQQQHERRRNYEQLSPSAPS